MNAKAQDPYASLDVSVFTKEQLPEIWHQKRLDDWYAREASLDGMPKVSGETIAERRDSFLRRYASGPFADA